MKFDGKIEGSWVSNNKKVVDNNEKLFVIINVIVTCDFYGLLDYVIRYEHLLFY